MSDKKIDTHKSIDFDKSFETHYRDDFEILDLWYDPSIIVHKDNLQIQKFNTPFKHWIDSKNIVIESSLAPIFPLFQPNGEESLPGLIKEIDSLSDSTRKRRFTYYLKLDKNNNLTKCEITISAFDHLSTSIHIVIRSIPTEDKNEVSQLESALTVSENKINQLLTNSDICSIIFTKSGEIKNISDSCLSLLHYPDNYRPDHTLKNVKDLIHEFDHESFHKLSEVEDKEAHRTFLRIKTYRDIYLYIKPLGAISKIQYQGSIEYLFLFTDLTEQIKANDILLATMKEYKSIIEASPSAIVKLDLDGYIIFANSEAIHIHGLSHEEIMGMNVNDLFEVPNQTFVELLRKKLNFQLKGKGRKILHSIHSSRGEIVTELTYTKIETKDKQGYLLSYLDITEKEVFKTSLKHSKTKLKSVIDFSNTGIAQINSDLKIEYISKTANELLNHNNSSPIGTPFESLLTEKSKESFDLLIEEIHKSGQGESKELIEFKTKDELTLVKLSGLKISDKEKSSILLVYNNYSEKVKSELALIEKESNMHTILENSPFAIYAIDRNYNVIFINKIAISDFKRHQNVRIKLGDNLSEKIKSSTFNSWHKTIFSKVFKGESFNKVGPAPNNYSTILDSKYSPLLDAHGNVTGCIEVSRDITSVKKKEYELIEREAYLTSILNSSPNSIIVLDADLNLTATNPKATQLFKSVYGKDIAVNENLCDNLPEDYSEEIKSIVQRVFTDEMIKFLRTHPNKDKTNFYEYTFSPVKDKLNAIIGCKLLIQDQTQILHSERALMDSEIKHKELLELLPGGILITKANGHIMYASPTMKEMIGIPKYGKIDRDSYNSFVSEVQRMRETVTDLEIDENLTKTYRLKTLNQQGETIWLEARTKEIRFKKENANLTLLLDITEKVNSEKDRDLKQKLYEVLIENSFDGIDIIEYTKDNGTFNSTLLMRNERMMEFFNSDTEPLYSFDALMERAPKFQLNGKLSSETLKNDINYYVKYGHFVIERQVLNESRQLRNVIISMQKLKFNDKRLIVRYYKDITDKKLKEIQIQESLAQLSLKNKELEKYIAVNLDLENFAHIASHDLKSPLRTIRSFAQLLIRDIYESIPQKNRTYLDIINKSSNNMANLIDDVLSFSKLESEQANIKEILCQPYIDFLLTQIKDEIEEHKAEISLINIPAVIYSDSVKLSQVLQNLIRNSLKFQKKESTPKIEISVDSLDKYWQFNIKDNGIGIDQKHIDSIFKIFKRLHNKSQYSGSGIGLSTCQKTIAKLGGEIWVNSTLNEGSTFSFTIPKKQNTEDSRDDPQS